MMNNIKFSVIIPVYQKEPFLKKCIESVLKQSFKDYEIILVDDGSTDNSSEICKNYSVKNENVFYYYKENSGVSAARNYGIEKSIYKYIAFIDADDFWEKDFLSEIVYLIKKYPQCGMYSTGYCKLTNGLRIENESGIKEDALIDDYFKHSIKYSIVNSSNVVILKEILLDVKGFPEGMIDSEDLYTWAKVALKCKCCYSDKKLSYYNLDSEGWRMRKKRLDTKKYFFTDLLDGSFYNFEYLSFKAYKKAILYLVNGFKDEADMQIRPFLGSKLYKSNMMKYRFLRLFEPSLISFYLRIEAGLFRRFKK